MGSYYHSLAGDNESDLAINWPSLIGGTPTVAPQPGASNITFALNGGRFMTVSGVNLGYNGGVLGWDQLNGISWSSNQNEPVASISVGYINGGMHVGLGAGSSDFSHLYDVVMGGTGTPTSFYQEDDDTFYHSQLHGESGRSLLWGSTGDDFITGGRGADDLRGNGGDDTFRINAGEFEAGEHIEGGSGDRNTIEVKLANNEVDLRVGTISGIQILRYIPTVDGAGAHGSAVTIGQSQVTVGLRAIWGGAGADSLFIRDVDDVSMMSFTDWNDVEDTIHLYDHGTGMKGTVRNDIIHVGGGNTIDGFSGDDVFIYNSTSVGASIVGGSGIDTVRLDSANVDFSGYVNWGTTLEYLRFNSGESTVTLTGYTVSSGKMPTVIGSAGKDTLTFLNLGDNNWNLDISALVVTQWTEGVDRIIINETASGAHTFIGSNYADIIDGGGGDDIIYGLGGNDVIRGRPGNGFIDGGDGIDTVIYVGNRASYTITVGQTNVTVAGPGGTNTTLVNVERLQFDDMTLTLINTPPTATIENQKLPLNEWAAVRNLVTTGDADGNTITQYQFFDSGTAANSGYFWTLAHGQEAANNYITVAASDLATTWVRAGQVSGSETMWVRAFDGSDWSPWDAFQLTSNAPPVATIDNHSLPVNQWANIASWISYSDTENTAATQYQFFDSGTATGSGYLWTLAHGQEPANNYITVAASDLSTTWVRGGQFSGTDTMWVRAFDGNAWSEWDAFQLTTTNTAPVATIDNHSLHANTWTPLGNWITYSDADNSAATQYQFFDSGTAAGSGYFWTLAHGQEAANNYITVAASDLGTTWVRGGQTNGSETMWVRAFDGSVWSEWDAFQLTTTNTAPVATIADHVVGVNEWSALRNWLATSDADGDVITQYQFYDSGTGANSGYFWTPNNAHHDALTYITVPAADLATAWVRGGQVSGTETMWVRAFDGTDWSAWDAFSLITA